MLLTQTNDIYLRYFTISVFQNMLRLKFWFPWLLKGYKLLKPFLPNELLHGLCCYIIVQCQVLQYVSYLKVNDVKFAS